jgi:glycosyltransferase involved in cell wall biosynthesis
MHGKRHKTIVVSGVNFFEGGPLSLMRDCLVQINRWASNENIQVLALVHKIDLYADLQLSKITLEQFPASRRSYFHRLLFEHWIFKRYARKNHVDHWFSLHDISPSLGDIRQSVYCHNPAPFYKTNLQEFLLDPKFWFFSIFYFWLYRINIRKNAYVVVQQAWLREQFALQFSIERSKIIVAHPNLDLQAADKLNSRHNHITFFYPTLSRIFKNIEIICRAVVLLNSKLSRPFEVIVTIDGSENRYAKTLVSKYRNVPNLKFIGKQPRKSVLTTMASADCLLFPSKLETWGLPISEFKLTGNAILAADLPYAHETVGDYEQVCFFDPENANQLCDLMLDVIEGKIAYHGNVAKRIDAPFVHDWQKLFDLLFK